MAQAYQRGRPVLQTSGLSGKPSRGSHKQTLRCPYSASWADYEVINFTGWSPEGPAFEELDIIGSSSGARDVRDSLPSLLNDELRRSFGMMD